MIVIIDYDIGNISAVANMLLRVGVRCKISRQAEDVEQAERIILPGNGSFDACMLNLRASGLIPILEHKVLEQGTPLLGICVGAQMLGHTSAEGNEAGLGWLDMEVRRFPDMPGLRVPHMGWNQVTPVGMENRLTQEMEADSRFYFVHSYFMEPKNQEDVLLKAHYGIDFAAGVSRDNIAGVQFHPEKSHRFGKKLLASFVKGE
ncbi:imidazole glycerol phosphate synthase subunit HisH [Pseudomonas auratipiscis]|uniref:Imidazole glycerol phosphate synthase subunit HisH n=1 Tax=Pseudomonas auratipiscis TaxID=3115853 RepID=A0AB35WV32_9PSED|nr:MULTISPECIES: imidazole glycerol phosphate synthase subunit HisH [unclassified Pseudomonas]MEE1867159.1 imidazole glycerol phosphate synthase subunit HisH [Pseudomonas sp. 120P]MEE1957986.1 imidazole glycerol phosphate synthase subunit HisH [Pseudomonas sp. 119P]